MKRKPCGRPIAADSGRPMVLKTTKFPNDPNWSHMDTIDAKACGYERMPGKQQCVWHWLLKQPADVQKEYAEQRAHIASMQHDFRPRVPKNEWPRGERWCAGCQSFVPLFYVQGSRCRSCNSTAAHASKIEKTYGITGEEYQALFKLQGGRCYICQRTARSRRLAVDHDHETGEVRGLLCSDNDRGCNHAILGNIRDLAMAERIVEYIKDPPYSRLLRDREVADAREDDRPWTNPNKPGRRDVNGRQWWACDPYPTWFYREGGELHTAPSYGIRWADEQSSGAEPQEPPF